MNPVTFDRIQVDFIPEDTSLRINSYIVAGGLLILGVVLSILSVICLDIGLVGLSAGAAFTLGLGCLIFALFLFSFSLILLLSQEKRVPDVLCLYLEKEVPQYETPLYKEDLESERDMSAISERLGIIEEKLRIAEKFRYSDSVFV
ncbi:hypothetical protein CPK_ORF00721 [Chlamydia pneumoniae LPCoLN]|uniref:hypothetical protein n=1 Tax=Chlamydia pneumoniae TaxID=83558 RepID=UPI0001BD9CF9|nr:hypothetical protein [Chlamydia pneumoniae]ACZ33190.1 hypothetical protein CPK_ORF00721 [Chlamydia pneumoniae LPCoLN]ETR80090.1 hypothetical protein X556_0580 [Chlamydia pneumoniae B21]